MNIGEFNTLKIVDVIYVKSLEAKYLIQKAILFKICTMKVRMI